MYLDRCNKSSKVRPSHETWKCTSMFIFWIWSGKEKVKVFGSHTFLMALIVITWITWSVEKVSSLLYISLCQSLYIYKKFTLPKYFQFWKSSHTGKKYRFQMGMNTPTYPMLVSTDSKEHQASFTTTFTPPFDPTCLSGFIFNF